MNSSMSLSTVFKHGHKHWRNFNGFESVVRATTSRECEWPLARVHLRVVHLPATARPPGRGHDHTRQGLTVCEQMPGINRKSTPNSHVRRGRLDEGAVGSELEQSDEGAVELAELVGLVVREGRHGDDGDCAGLSACKSQAQRPRRQRSEGRSLANKGHRGRMSGLNLIKQYRICCSGRMGTQMAVKVNRMTGGLNKGVLSCGCVRVCACICACVRACVRASVSVSVGVSVYVYVCVCVCVCVCISVRLSLCLSVLPSIRPSVCDTVHAWVRGCKRACVHACMRSFVR